MSDSFFLPVALDFLDLACYGLFRGMFVFGDAGDFGSLGSSHVNSPIEGMAATADGLGYWLASTDGGAFAFGDAPFLGSMGGQRLNKPMIGLTSNG